MMKPHILLIDDSQMIRESLSNVLLKRDYTLTSVSSGIEGLAYIEQHHCDLILLDYALPDTDGVELLQIFVKKYPETPVIMITGSGSERLAVKALKSGASDYLVKTADFIPKIPHLIKDNLERYKMKKRNRDLENQLRESFRQQKQLNRELEEKVLARTEELERAYQLSNELMAKAVDSNMQLAELYTEVDESRRKLDATIRELSLLNDMGKLIASTTDKDQLLQISLDSVHEELGVDHCAILLLNEKNQQLQVGVSYGTPDDLLLAANAIDGKRELWNVIKRDAPLLIQDIEFDEHFHLLLQDYPRLECFLLIPMRIKSHEIGIFTVYGYEHNATLTPDDLNFVSSLASQTSIALTNIASTAQKVQHEQIRMVGHVTDYLMSDVRAPLMAVRKMTEGAHDKQQAPEEIQHFSQILIGQIDSVIATTEELLEYSQGESGELDRQTCSVQEFVEEIVSHIESRFTEQQITIHQQLEYTGNMTIDRQKMRIVFLSIARKVRHAMPEGGQFTIASRLINHVLQLECSADEKGLITSAFQANLSAPLIFEHEEHVLDLDRLLMTKVIHEHDAHLEIVEQGTAIRLSFPQPESTREKQRE